MIEVQGETRNKTKIKTEIIAQYGWSPGFGLPSALGVKDWKSP